MKTNSKNQKIKNKSNNKISNPTIDEIPAEKLTLEPVGYPFKFNLIETSSIEISDDKLFEEYAKEQWLGIELKKDSYLFDQKMIPDYGFKIVNVNPENSVLTNETEIIINKTDTISEKLEQNTNNVKFDDIVGQKTAKNKLKIIEKYVQNPEKFGQWAPQNILFYGLPGTGKTMLAKALASNLDIPLYLVKATSLIGGYVGDGSRQIHELYENASKNAPSLIFIDEIDAIALHRQFQSLRGDVSEIVNSLLTELDGINPNTGVITIGATNNINFLDSAVRSRFEEEIEFKLPTDKERKEIIKRNLKTIPVDYDLDIDKIVKYTKGMSGRDLKEKILKTAVHHGIAHDKKKIDMLDINHALKQSKKKTVNEVKDMYE